MSSRSPPKGGLQQRSLRKACTEEPEEGTWAENGKMSEHVASRRSLCPPWPLPSGTQFYGLCMSLVRGGAAIFSASESLYNRLWLALKNHSQMSGPEPDSSVSHLNSKSQLPNLRLPHELLQKLSYMFDMLIYSVLHEQECHGSKLDADDTTGPKRAEAEKVTTEIICRRQRLNQ